MRKKIVLLFVSLFLTLFMTSCAETESQRIRRYKLPPIDLSAVNDGTYVGQYTHHGVLYKLEVVVLDHRIVDIRILSSEGDDYDIAALAVLDRVIEEQSLDVDAVSGATKSSKIYLICIYNALTGEDIAL